MKVLVAAKRGFCFGVEHAIELAEKLLAEKREVYCLGPLIHNKQVVDRLARLGLKMVECVEQIPGADSPGSSKGGFEAPTVLIRSHGCHPDLLEEIRHRGLNLADATCVLVKRAQKLVSQLHLEGYQVVVVGDPNHPEVQGVVGFAPAVIVVAGGHDLGKLPAGGRLAVISQTTHSHVDFERIVALIRRCGYEDMKVVNTICRETTRRQDSAIEVCRQVEVMFVLGSRHSANTGELANLCERNGVRTYHLEGWHEFRSHHVEGKQIAGVTAGASTPDWVIQEFVDDLRAL